MLTEGGTCLELSEDDDVKKNQLELAHVTQIRLQNTKLKELSKEKKETLILIASRAVCVYLDNNRLKSLPAELQSFTALRELHLENNLLKKLSKKLFSLETLEELHLRGNQLTEIPGHIRNLKNLRLLDISNNKIKHLPVEIGNLESLVTLEVQGNTDCVYPPAALIKQGALVVLQFLQNEWNTLKELKEKSRTSQSPVLSRVKDGEILYKRPRSNSLISLFERTGDSLSQRSRKLSLELQLPKVNNKEDAPPPAVTQEDLKSLASLVTNERGYKCLLEFLEQEYSSENLLFWNEVNQLNKLEGSEWIAAAKKIYHTYIAEDSTNQLNISSSLKNKLDEVFTSNDDSKITKDVFDDVQGVIMELMRADGYRRFIVSDTFKVLQKEAEEYERYLREKKLQS